MNDRMGLAHKWRAPKGPWCAALFGLALVGCASAHRISLEKFLQMQQVARQPATEETDGREPKAIDIDRYLGPYEIGPSDVMEITLVGTDENGVVPSFRSRVDRNGAIDLPIVGSTPVADKTLEDVEDAIRAAYMPGVYRNVVVHVELVEPDTTNVLVVGAVSEPGLIQLRRNQRNMLFAIVGAGGASDEASGWTMLRRIRHPEEQHSFDLRDPKQLQQALALDPLEQGDIIYVDAAQPNTVFVGGLVNGIGPQTYPPGTEITILQAFAAAGGLRTDVFPKDATLIRRMDDGTDVHVRLDLNRLARGDDPNIALAAGDILWVPETWETRVQDFINRNIFLRAGVTVSYNVTGLEYLNRSSTQNLRTGGGFGGGNQESLSDPFGFLNRNSALRGIQGSLVP